MPLSTRTVSPVDLSVNRIPKSIGRDELQCVANGTLANLIRQLSSLSKNAEQIFREVHREVLKIDHKATTLFLRVERLAQKVAQPGFTRAEPGGLEENHLRKAFKSTNIIDQHSLNRQTLPTFIYELHQKCEPPPELNSLNPYRDDSKSALCFYTDPDYFFNLWKEEMLKESVRGGGGSGANKSPSRTRRKPRVPNTQLTYQAGGRQPYIQQVGMQANVLVNHYSATAIGAPQNIGRGAANGKSHEQLLNFPAEYQAPQHALNFNSRVVQAPPGMSLHATDARSTNQAFFQQQQEQYYQHQQQALTQQQQTVRQGYPYSSDGKYNNNTADTLGGNMVQRLTEMSINRSYQPAGGSDGGGPPQASTAATIAGQEPNFGGFLEEDEDDELPPPPPALSAHTMMTPPATSHASSSSLSSSAAPSDNAVLQQQQFVKPFGQHNQVPTTTLQYLPSGGALDSDRQSHTMAGGTSSISSAPPPPPPPPPPAPSGPDRADPAGSFSSSVKPPDEARAPLQACSASTVVQNSGGDQVSSLLLEIRSGIKLKNVQRKEELAENRAAQDSTDVAAILRRRMEHVLGNGDDSSESSSEDVDEWEE